VEGGETRVYWVSLAAAGLLLWLATLSWFGQDRDLVGREDVAVEATA
jgi:hypothetical protein